MSFVRWPVTWAALAKLEHYDGLHCIRTACHNNTCENDTSRNGVSHYRSSCAFNYSVSMLCNSIHVEWRCSLQLCWWWRRRRMFLWQQAVETVPATGRWEKDMIICYMLNYGRFVILSGTHIVLHKLQYTMFEANSAFHPSRVGKWVLRFGWEGKGKYGSFVSGWTRGVQVKLWDSLRTLAIPERLRGMFTTERYTNPLYLYLYLSKSSICALRQLNVHNC